MTNYRRNFIKGGTLFFTVNLADRRTRFLTENISQLQAALRYVRARHPLETVAIVVLPDHLHPICHPSKMTPFFFNETASGQVKLFAFFAHKRANIGKPPE